MSEDTARRLAETLARIIAKCRFGPGVTMDGRHMPRPSEVRAAEDFIAFQVQPLIDAQQATIKRLQDERDQFEDEAHDLQEKLNEMGVSDV